MIPELLLYTTLSCQQTDAIMLKIRANKYIDDVLKMELVDTVKESNPECDWYWSDHEQVVGLGRKRLKERETDPRKREKVQSPILLGDLQ